MSKKPFHFEQSLQEISSIVDKLDHEEVSVEESLRLYEQGMHLILTCQKYLNDSKGRIERIKKDHTGTVTAEELDSD